MSKLYTLSTNTKKAVSLIIFAVTMSLAFLSFSRLSQAQLLNNNSLSLGFAPTSNYLTLKYGQKYKGEITAWNLSPQTRTYDVIVRGFEQVENFPGTARLHTEEEEARDPFTASSWIKVPFTKVILVPNQNVKIPYEINVPKDAASGEFHAMIFLISQSSTVNLGESSTSSSNLGSGPVILINVGDKIVENAEIEYFKSEKSFYELPPVTFLTRYVNKSNTHITPMGDIILENFLGQEIGKTTFNTNKQSLLRGTSGNYSDEWDPKTIFTSNGKIAIGPIKARLITTYLSKNPGYAPLNAVTTFWVIPWRLILAILIIVGIIYRLIKYLVKKYVKKEVPKRNIDNYPLYN